MSFDMIESQDNSSQKQTVSGQIEHVVSRSSSGESLPKLCSDCGSFVRENCTCLECLFG